MLAAQVGQVDWSAEIEAMVGRARARNLPELSGDEMMSEIKSMRAARWLSDDCPDDGRLRDIRE